MYSRSCCYTQCTLVILQCFIHFQWLISFFRRSIQNLEGAGPPLLYAILKLHILVVDVNDGGKPNENVPNDASIEEYTNETITAYTDEKIIGILSFILL